MVRIQLRPRSLPAPFPTAPRSRYQNPVRGFIQVGERPREEGEGRKEGRREALGLISFSKIPLNGKCTYRILQPIQLEIRAVTKSPGGGGVRKLLHFSNQTKTYHKKGNKNKRISNCNFPAISVHAGADPTQRC